MAARGLARPRRPAPLGPARPGPALSAGAAAGGCPSGAGAVRRRDGRSCPDPSAGERPGGPGEGAGPVPDEESPAAPARPGPAVRERGRGAGPAAAVPGAAVPGPRFGEAGKAPGVLRALPGRLFPWDLAPERCSALRGVRAVLAEGCTCVKLFPVRAPGPRPRSAWFGFLSK